MMMFLSSARPNIRFHILARVLLVVFVATGLLKAEVAIDGPVGFVGDGYGKAEVKYLTERVAPEVDGLSFENCGSELPAKEFSKFRMVVIAGIEVDTYTAEETQIIEDYVRQGGRLVLVQQAPKAFRATGGGGDRDLNYLFGRSYYLRDNPDCTVYEPENPLFAGALVEEARPFWLNATVMLRGLDWENLIGSNDYILVGRLRLGEGEAYYMGHEVFRLAKTAKEKNQEPALLGWIQIWKNILSPPEAK